MKSSFALDQVPKQDELKSPFQDLEVRPEPTTQPGAGMLLGISGFLADEYDTVKALLGCKGKPEKNKDVLSLVTYCGVGMFF